MALETHMSGLKSEWEDRIRRYSDERAIDHARAITEQSVNQGIKDLDADGVIAELRTAKESMVYTEQDIAAIQDTALNQIVRDKTMNYARMLEDEGMLWLMGEEAGDKFAVEVDGQRYFLDQEIRNDMAAELSAERSNRKKAVEAANWQSRKTMLDYVQEQIANDNLNSVEELYGDDHQEAFIQKHGFILDLNDEDKGRVREVLADRAEAFEKDREAYSDDMLDAVSDAIKAGDAETAKRYLDELVDEGYAYDAMGRVDPEYRRYREQYDRMLSGEALGAFDVDANALRAKLRAGTLSREDLAQFLEAHPTKEGRVEHDKMWNELEQQRRERESGTQNKELEIQMKSDYDEHFYSVYDNLPGNTTNALEKLNVLDRWRYDNYPKNKKDPGLPGIDTATWRTYGRLIEAKKRELQAPEIAMRKSMVDRGEKQIIDWYAGKIREESEFNPEAANKLRTERDNKVAEYHDLLRDKELEDPIALADFLLTDPQRERVKKKMGLFSGRREETDIEYYTRLGVPEMIPEEQQRAAAAQQYAEARRGEIPAAKLVSPKPPVVAGIQARFEKYSKREDGSLDVISNGTELRIYNTESGQWELITQSELIAYEQSRNRE